MSRVTRGSMEAREKESANLRALGVKLEKAASLINVAGIYWVDGAYDTARTRIRTVTEIVADVQDTLGVDGWAVLEDV